jgi:hypothetical protein
LTNEIILDDYTLFKNEYLTSDYHGENKITQKENTLFQLSTVEYQQYNTQSNISSIDLGRCESILKTKYNLLNESLIILKADIKDKDSSSTYVQYEIYHPHTLEKLNMSLCKEVTIVINSPVNLKDQAIALYESLNKSGYNLFDTNDPFYTDVCTPYTTVNGTDIIIQDRQNQIYSIFGNVTLCQNECTFESFNTTTEKAKCNCGVQINSTNTNIEEIKLSNNLILNTFLITIKFSNLMVLRCFSIAFDLTSFTKNIGRLLMSIILFIFLILFFFFLFYDRKKINYLIIIKRKIVPIKKMTKKIVKK